jgi:N-methylhydantoinase A
MGFTVDIDTGGTFTDGLFGDGTSTKRAKVDTTPHDLTISLFNCLYAGATAFGFSSVRELLLECDIVRWTNTIATNVVAEKKGPRLGLFVSQGFENTLYSGNGQSPAIGHLVGADNVVGVAQPPDIEDLLVRLKSLLDQGVRRICISLKDGLENSADEMAVKKVFEEQYPDHYLGTIPLLMGSDICKHPDDMTRTHVALLNAYVHGPVAQAMYKAEDDLRHQGFVKPLLVGHINGGVTRVAKTKPVDTIESGPIFGIHAAAYFAEKYGLQHVITLDVGGTTTKVGLVQDAKPALTRHPDVFGVPLRQPMLTLKSISLGGGTVARVGDGGLVLGPDSMGAYPGPACYDLGGTEATLTDAYLVSGFLDPDYFAGGTKRVVLERAKKALADSVGSSLDLDEHAAAAKVAELAADMVVADVRRAADTIHADTADQVLFAFGGNGGVAAARVAEKAHIRKVVVFSLGSVLSAFGSSVADVAHTYEYAPFLPVGDTESVEALIAEMWAEACRDFRGEGFDENDIIAEVEFTVTQSPDHHNVEEVVCGFDVDGSPEAGQTGTCMADAGVQPGKDSLVEIVRLHARVPAVKAELVARPLGEADPSSAKKGSRTVWWDAIGGVETALYEWDRLAPGACVEGPAVVESVDTTYLVPARWDLRIDTFGNGLMERR